VTRAFRFETKDIARDWQAIHAIEVLLQFFDQKIEAAQYTILAIARTLGPGSMRSLDDYANTVKSYRGITTVLDKRYPFQGQCCFNYVH
jgi:hypothetical protein